MLSLRSFTWSAVIWGAMLSSGCAASPDNPTTEEVVTWPTEWPQPDPRLLSGGECPRLDGTYTHSGSDWSVTVDEGNRLQSEGHISAWVLLDTHPRNGRLNEKLGNPALHQRKATTADSETLGGKFVIFQETPARFSVATLSRYKDHVDTAAYEQREGDFHCEKGFVIFKTKRPQEGNSEGVAQRFVIESRMTRAADGSLLYHEKVSNHWRQLFFFSGVRITNSFYRFARAE